MACTSAVTEAVALAEALASASAVANKSALALIHAYQLGASHIVSSWARARVWTRVRSRAQDQPPQI